MPFTVFHFGPGLLVKSAFRARFSFLVFILAQIITDVETLYNILAGSSRLHTFFHSYIGATVSAFITFFAFKYFLTVMNKPFGKRVLEKRKLQLPSYSNAVIFVSALIGTMSHVFLDSIFHGDVCPFYPLSEANSLFQSLNREEVHLLCVGMGIIGGGIWWQKKTRL